MSAVFNEKTTITDDRVGRTSFEVFDPQIGETNIFWPEVSDSGLPEVDFDSGRGARSGSFADLIRAVRLTKTAMEEYRCRYGDTQFVCHPDNRDGFGEARERVIRRYLPDVTILEKYDGVA